MEHNDTDNVQHDILIITTEHARNELIVYCTPFKVTPYVSITHNGVLSITHTMNWNNN